MNTKTLLPSQYISFTAYLLAAIALVFILGWRLLPAMLAGLLIHELVYLLAPWAVKNANLKHRAAKFAAVGILAIIVISFVSILIAYIVHFLLTSNENLPQLISKMETIVESARPSLPNWLSNIIPNGGEALTEKFAALLKTYQTEIISITKDSGRAIAHILIGMIIGGMIALYEFQGEGQVGPLAQALTLRAKRLAESFRQVVFAQVRIAALNTVFTAIFLVIVLPIAGVNLPFKVTMILLTFLFGLLPVIGNLLSNTIIVVVSLSVSPTVAVASLVFLVLIHKVEYFLNAKIIGHQIQTHAWEILLAMIVMEVLFGVPGIIAAPIFYAYLKKELKQAGLV